MTVPEALQWLEALRVAIWIRESAYGFSLVVAIHILSLALSVGTLVWVDLRLLGVAMRQTAIADVYRGLAPWFLAGFGLMLVSGASLFAAYATAAYGNVFFRVKMAVLALASVNALVFHFVSERSAQRWAGAARLPTAARAAGGLSLACWLVVIVAGRLMSYTIF
jgi:hypothetical protein